MRISLLIQVLLAILLGLIAGLLTSLDSNWLGVPLVELYALMRDLFLNAVMLIVVPLFVSYLVIASTRKGKGCIQVFGTFAFVALLVFLITFFQPSHIEWPDALKNTSKSTESKPFAMFSIPFFLFIPSNILAAASQNNLFGVSMFALFFGFSIKEMDEHAAATLHSFFTGVFQVMMLIMSFIMHALPIGVFGMVAYMITTGLAITI